MLPTPAGQSLLAECEAQERQAARELSLAAARLAPLPPPPPRLRSPVHLNLPGEGSPPGAAELSRLQQLSQQLRVSDGAQRGTRNTGTA